MGRTKETESEINEDWIFTLWTALSCSPTLWHNAWVPYQGREQNVPGRKDYHIEGGAMLLTASIAVCANLLYVPAWSRHYVGLRATGPPGGESWLSPPQQPCIMNTQLSTVCSQDV